jgi:plastocyanin
MTTPSTLSRSTARQLPAEPGSVRARRTRTVVASGVMAGGMLLASLLGAGLLTACGSDADQGSATATSTAQPGSASPRPVVVTATDYAFAGLPDEVPAGTQLRLVNDSSVEIHELVAIRVPDGDDRPVEELLHDPALETMAPTTVLLTPPGADQIPAVGDGTLSEPGRYVVICTIPTGVSPQAFLDAAKAAGGGKPVIPDAGAPHLAHGMFADVVVV